MRVVETWSKGASSPKNDTRFLSVQGVPKRQSCARLEYGRTIWLVLGIPPGERPDFTRAWSVGRAGEAGRVFRLAPILRIALFAVEIRWPLLFWPQCGPRARACAVGLRGEQNSFPCPVVQYSKTLGPVSGQRQQQLHESHNPRNPRGRRQPGPTRAFVQRPRPRPGSERSQRFVSAPLHKQVRSEHEIRAHGCVVLRG